MMLKILARYILGPSAVVATLAGLGVFDDMTPGAQPSSGNPAERVLSALEKPLALAERIAVAGGGELGFSAEDVSGMFDSFGSAEFGGGGTAAAAGGGAASISRHSGSH